jgi:HK97 family phage major capsid protein
VFARLRAAGGGNSIPTLTNQNPLLGPQRFLGFPVIVSQKMPFYGGSSPSGKIVCFFGRMDMAVMMGQRREITINRSNDRFFDSDQIGLLGTERIDIVAHDLGSSTTAGPLVALKMG